MPIAPVENFHSPFWMRGYPLNERLVTLEKSRLAPLLKSPEKRGISFFGEEVQAVSDLIAERLPSRFAANAYVQIAYSAVDTVAKERGLDSNQKTQLMKSVPAVLLFTTTALCPYRYTGEFIQEVQELVNQK